MRKRRLLIVCTGNLVLSQMAEGLIRHEAGDRFEVFSAGTQPTRVDGEAAAVMREPGIQNSNLYRSSPGDCGPRVGTSSQNRIHHRCTSCLPCVRRSLVAEHSHSAFGLGEWLKNRATSSPLKNKCVRLSAPARRSTPCWTAVPTHPEYLRPENPGGMAVQPQPRAQPQKRRRRRRE